MKKFELKKFLLSTFVCSAMHTSLISCVLIPFFKNASMLPLQISILITVKRLVRLIGDMFFGLIFDRFGAKIVFLSGRIMKLLSYFILFLDQSFILLCMAMTIYGLSEGTIQGKVSSFIYNNLKVNNKLSAFSRAISAYYLVIDIHIAIMSFLAGILLKIYGYNLVIYISIFMNIISIFLLIKLIPNNDNSDVNGFRAKSIKSILDKLKIVASKNHLFYYLIGMYGILVFFAWQFGSIASMVLLDMGMDGTGVATLGSMVKVCMALGTFIPVFFYKNTLSLNKIMLILLLFVFLGVLSASLYNIYVFCVFMLLIELVYVILEVSLEKNLEEISDRTVRGTAISIAMTFSNIIAVIANLVVGFIAQYTNYKISLCIIFYTMFFICCFIFLKIKKVSINTKIQNCAV